MKNTNSAGTISKSAPLFLQVETHFLDRIRSGELPAGSRLPSNAEIALQTGVSVFSVQRAMQNLVRSGLIERRRKAGTFVKGNGIKLACAGIYLGRDIWHDPEAGFYIALMRELQQALAAHNVTIRTWADSRPPSLLSTPLVDLQKAVEAREVQALLVPVCNAPEFQWLRKLDLPVSFMTDADVPNRLRFDDRQMFRLAMERLHAQGCRSVGLISNVGPIEEARTESDRYGYRNAFLDMAREFGMEVRDSWVRTPAGVVALIERFGYEQFHALWQQAERPRGLIVHPDTAAKGVVVAMLEAGVRVPRDVRLVLHRNRGVDFLCPLEAAWVETDVASVAAGMVRQIWTQLANKPVRPIVVPFAMGEGGSGLIGTKQGSKGV